MSFIQAEFGYCPFPIQLESGPISIDNLPNFLEAVALIKEDEGVERGWIYAPPYEECKSGGRIRALPYPSRVFGLPKTHVIKHASADGDEHLSFHIWALSFFAGMRFTATECGFVDATPIKPSTLVDFVLFGNGLKGAVELAEAFWKANRLTLERPRLWSAAVHALFLGQNPQALQFERLIFLYAALDACFALAKSIQQPNKRLNHAERLAWMCGLYSIPVPVWANPSAPAGSEVAAIRNATIHEALFMGKPLGFALHGVGGNQNLTVEMKALICRILAALIGVGDTNYIQSPVDTYQARSLCL